MAPVFAHTHCTCQNCKIIGNVKMETTGMWGLTLIILKDIKCFQIWAYFEGIGINFNFENFQNKIFPLFILRTIQRMHARYHRTLQHLLKIEGWFESGRFDALKSDSTHQVRVITVFTVFRLLTDLSVYILMSFDSPFERLFGVR